MLQLLHSLPWKSWRRWMAPSGGGAGRRRQRPARRFRPHLEFLEDRTVLSTFTVTNLSDSGPGSLRDAITSANASPGSIINFAPGLTGSINLNSVLIINTDMEIDGPGATSITLNGQHKTRVMQTLAGNVTINDLTIANGRAADTGGGIFDVANSLSLTGVTFASNQASFFGGAIYSAVFTTPSGALTVIDCLFTGNRVVGPVGNQIFVGGGAITNDLGTLTVIGTKFTNNTVLGTNGGTASFSLLGQAEGGAVLDFSDIATYTGCTFSGNSARAGSNGTSGAGDNTIGDGQGGAIEVTGGTVQVDLSTFNANGAQGGRSFDVIGGGRIGIGRGGAIHVDSGGQFTANNDTFTNNRALGANFGTGVASSPAMNEGEGGAISAEDSGSAVIVAGSTFTGNTAVGGISGFLTPSGGFAGSPGAGGAIWLFHASADISGSTFKSNVALGGNGTGDGYGGRADGGAVAIVGSVVTISGSQFVQNRSQGGIGGPSALFGGLSDGGGLFAGSGNISLLDLLFSSNLAIGGTAQGTGDFGGSAFGGGLEVLVGSIVNADNLTVKSNMAQGGAGLNGANGGVAFGGVIEAFLNTACTIADSLVTLNKALGGVASGGGSNGTGQGGGISHLGLLDLTNTLVTGNFASTSNNDIL